MSTRSSVAVILICGFTSLLLAQAPPAPPKPGPEHKKLKYFLGKWTVEGEFKPNGYVPAGKTVSTETDTLGPGGFYVESRAEGQFGTRLAISNSVLTSPALQINLGWVYAAVSVGGALIAIYGLGLAVTVPNTADAEEDAVAIAAGD